MLGELRMPRLKSSLCGCSLETGSKIIAYIHILLIGGFILLLSGEFIFREIMNFKSAGANATDDFLGVFVREESLFSLILIFFLFSSSFFIGVHKRCSMLLEPFIYMKVVFLIMSFFNIATFVMARVHGIKEFYIFPLLANTVFEAYTLTIVTSFKRQIDNREI